MLDDSLALNPLAGIRERSLVGTLGDGDTLQPDADPHVIHHRKHRAHSRVLRTHEVANAWAVFAEAHRARRRGMDAELVLDRHATNVIAGASNEELRHEEQ